MVKKKQHSTDSENTAIPQCEIKTTKVPKKNCPKPQNGKSQFPLC